MKFNFKNLGLLDEAEIEIADLTIICGENNTGKTYATYAIYGFLRSWRRSLQFIISREIEDSIKTQGSYQFDLEKMFDGKINVYLDKVSKEYQRLLPRVFAAKANTFNDCIIQVKSNKETDFKKTDYSQRIQSGPQGKVLATINKEPGSSILDVLVADEELLQVPFGGLSDFIAEAISEIVFFPHLTPVHISSAERTGAAIFRKELDMARTRMLKAINEIDSKELKRNPFQVLNKFDSDYAWPVEDNVEFVRQLEDIDKHTGELANADILTAFDAVIGGSYKVIKDVGLVFQSKGTGKQRFTMNEASSCVRALLDVGFYLRCRAKPGDLFIIDEPELNLHPTNQRALARLVARLINVGVKVFITTHSDYLIKEFNTLIMLNQKTQHTRAIQATYEYDDAELLDFNCVRLYMTGTKLKPAEEKGKRATRINTLIPAQIYPDRGIEVATFDDTIEIMNQIQSEILYGGDL